MIQHGNSVPHPVVKHMGKKDQECMAIFPLSMATLLSLERVSRSKEINRSAIVIVQARGMWAQWGAKC